MDIINMERQQIFDKNYLYMNQQEQAGAKNMEMQMKYKDFYAGVPGVFENGQLDQFCSEFDNMDEMNNEIDFCYHHWDPQNFNSLQVDHAKLNPKVADVPTVYLITCIRSQHLPQSKNWEKQETQDKIYNIKCDKEKLKFQCERTKNKQNLTLDPNYSNTCTDNFSNQHFSHTYLVMAQKSQKSKIVYAGGMKRRCNHRQQYQWKTQILLIRSQWFPMQEKEKKIMHKSRKVIQQKTNNKSNIKNERYIRNCVHCNNNIIFKNLVQNQNNRLSEKSSSKSKMRSDQRGRRLNGGNHDNEEMLPFIYTGGICFIDGEGSQQNQKSHNYKRSHIEIYPQQQLNFGKYFPKRDWDEKPKTKYRCLNMIFLGQSNQYHTQHILANKKTEKSNKNKSQYGYMHKNKQQMHQ